MLYKLIRASARQLREKSLSAQNPYKEEKPKGVSLETRVAALETMVEALEKDIATAFIAMQY